MSAELSDFQNQVRKCSAEELEQILADLSLDLEFLRAQVQNDEKHTTDSKIEEGKTNAVREKIYIVKNEFETRKFNQLGKS